MLRYMITQIKDQITQTLKAVGIETAELSTPPKADMGELAFPCFALAKSEGKNPAEVATALAEKLNDLFTKEEMKQSSLIKEVKSFGPYVNFFLDESELASFVLSGITKNYGSHTLGKGKKVVIEFGCPNPMKVFHLGHLKNLITGEAVVRTFANAGYDVVRVNYQGDVGMHIARVLWGVLHGEEFGVQGSWDSAEDAMKKMEALPLSERVATVGKAYTEGATADVEGTLERDEIRRLNEMVYEKDPIVQIVYATARRWSLEYFDTIYKKLGSHFDKMYFESETYERGVELVNEGKGKGIFKDSEGAIIFPGSEHDLHDRVFINSKGYPTYEGKETALAEMHFKDHDPYQVIHVVGKEQTGYFQVVFKALEALMPKTKGREYHLVGGYLQLKGDQKMSSRSGNVISGDALLEEVEVGIRKILDEREGDTDLSEESIAKITAAALKYAMLKSNVSEDVAFDMEESVSTMGDSGPYLLYIVARINSILAKTQITKSKTISNLQFSGNTDALVPISTYEKQLLIQLAKYPEATRRAVESYDPSYVAKYTFDLAQAFNAFYANCPVLDAEEDIQSFRIALILAVKQVMTAGLHLLGIETVEEM